MIPTLETVRICETRSCETLQNEVGHVRLRPSRRPPAERARAMIVAIVTKRAAVGCHPRRGSTARPHEAGPALPPRFSVANRFHGPSR